MLIQVHPVIHELVAFLSSRRIGPRLTTAFKRMRKADFRGAVVDLVSWLRNGYSRERPQLNVAAMSELVTMFQFVPDLGEIFAISEARLEFLDSVDDDARSNIVQFVRAQYRPPRRT